MAGRGDTAFNDDHLATYDSGGGWYMLGVKSMVIQ